MTDLALAQGRPTGGWLLNARFDLWFIVGIAAIAMLSGLAVVANPNLFGLILFLDLWLLGYHHVVATFTRLCFDRESFQRNKFLVVHLPVIVLAATLLLGFGVGLWTLGTIYLYWQWFHYTRQSWGISQSYRRKGEATAAEPIWFGKAVFYLIPLWGILHRSHQQPEFFLGLEVRVLPVPGLAVDLVGAAACLFLALWAVSRARMWLDGRLNVAHTLFMASHVAIFITGYVLIDDITHGWLVINIWHNAQYVVFVWMYNNRRFRDGADSRARLLSHISQARYWPLYVLVCLGLSTAAYGALEFAYGTFAIGIPIIVVYMTVNFHHYVVDGLIWKMRRKSMREILGLQPG